MHRVALGSNGLAAMVSPSVHDFASAGREVLAFLYQRFGFGLWMVTRKEGDDWIVLQSEDHGYNVTRGTVFRWADSFCSEMVQGNGPRVAPDSDAVPAYAVAPIGRQVDIKAYVGVPLRKANGDLFGTLCAIDPARQPASIVSEQGLIELLAALLSSILQSDLKASDESRRAEQLEVEAQTDPMTSLYNRRAWDRMLAKEEERCARYGHHAAVLMVDLDELKRVNDTLGHAVGDALIVRAADALRSAARGMDLVARLGGDEFGLLAVECDQLGAEALLARARLAFHELQVKASFGIAVRGHSEGLAEACIRADQRMYEDKRSG